MTMVNFTIFSVDFSFAFSELFRSLLLVVVFIRILFLYPSFLA